MRNVRMSRPSECLPELNEVTPANPFATAAIIAESCSAQEG